MTDLIMATHSRIRRSAADTFCSAVQVASHLNDVKQLFSRHVLFQSQEEEQGDKQKEESRKREAEETKPFQNKEAGKREKVKAVSKRLVKR